MRILILGAGGHAQVVADILQQMQAAGEPVTPIGYLDDNPALDGQTVLGLPVLGPLAALSATAPDAVVVAIGHNPLRARLYEQLQEQGVAFATACHPRAIIAPSVTIQPGTMICAGVVVNPGAMIGANVILNTGCIVDHHNKIGDHVHIAPGVRLGGDVTIGQGVLVGIGATVMPGRSVGQWSTIGAGAVVHRDLSDGITAVGVPARVMKERKS